MVNCTAAQRQDLANAVYGDYMDGIKSIIFTEGTDLSGVNLIKLKIGIFGAPFFA